MFTKTQLNYWRSLGIPFPSFYDEIASDPKPALKISVQSVTSNIDTFFIMLLVKSESVGDGDAQIDIIEINQVFKNTPVAGVKIKIKSTGSTSIKLSVQKSLINNLDPDYEWGGFEFKAFISCNGYTGETIEFKLEKARKEPPKKEAKKEPCICKKTIFTLEDVTYLVTQLRKLDTWYIDRAAINPDTGNKQYKDKDNKVYQSTARGRKPKVKGKTLTVLTERVLMSEFEYKSDGTAPDGDRLFFIDYPEKIIVQDATLTKFTTQINKIIDKCQLNSCILKMHFFAQIYQESQKLRATYEQSPSSNVQGGDDYRGRGIGQLTHDYNYLRYYDDQKGTTFFDIYMRKRLKDKFESVTAFNARTNNKWITVEQMDAVKEFATTVASDLFQACNSAAWYWNINEINKIAIDDSDNCVKAVSAKINNPDAKFNPKAQINGYDERQKYFGFLKILFKYDQCK